MSHDETVGSDTVQDKKEFNNQFLATQAKKGEQLVSMMPAFKKEFDLMGDDIVDLSTENVASKNKKQVLTMKNGYKNLKKNSWNT